MNVQISVSRETWPLAQAFTISRGTKTHAEVIVAETRIGGHRGHGECVPYPRYGESLDSVEAVIEDFASALGGTGIDDAGEARAFLQHAMPAGAARNALDCALWDLEAKSTGARAWSLCGRAAPEGVETAYTLSLADADAMGRAAATHSQRPLLKLKLDAVDVVERVSAVRNHAPVARLIVDANEAWTMAVLERVAEPLAELGVELIEQPLPADADSALASFHSPVPIGADESIHTNDDLADIRSRYDVINIKLDKTGGLTGALALLDAAHQIGLGHMVGCMVGTSLSMAPAMLIAEGASFVDLDGPLLLKADRPGGISYQSSRMSAPESALWG